MLFIYKTNLSRPKVSFRTARLKQVWRTVAIPGQYSDNTALVAETTHSMSPPFTLELGTPTRRKPTLTNHGNLSCNDYISGLEISPNRTCHCPIPDPLVSQQSFT